MQPSVERLATSQHIHTFVHVQLVSSTCEDDFYGWKILESMIAQLGANKGSTPTARIMVKPIDCIK